MFKFKTCEVMQYFEYYDVEEIAVIEDRIKSLTNIKKYAIVIHDKDLLDSGQPKKRHFHAVLTFSNATTSEIVAGTLHVEEQFVNKIKTTTKSAMLYLVHRNDPDKYQYEPSCVVANFDYIEYSDGCEPKQRREDLCKKIVDGTIKQYNLHEYITADEYGRNKSYYDRIFEYRQSKLKTSDRHLDCVFISGASGTGKTTYAKEFAKKKGYSVYLSSGGSHPLDNYRGEDCIILDDLRSSTYKLSDFLKLTDNNTDSLVGCRFYNKSIFECKLLIVTSVKSIYEFYSNALQEDKEPQVQLFRRFQTYISMYSGYMILYSFDCSTNNYVKRYKCANLVPITYNQSNDFVSDFVKSTDLCVLEDFSSDQLSF